MSQQPSQARTRRFISDLKKKLPEFPCIMDDCGLAYPDILKLQKRAMDSGISEAIAGDRLVWVNRTLSSLEEWAAEVLKVSKAGDILLLRDLLDQSESQFSRRFMRTVPLFKFMVASNRKSLKLLQEYENREGGWIPVDVASSPSDHIRSFVGSVDIQRLRAYADLCRSLESNGYFYQDDAVQLLRSLHPDDLRKNASYALLSKASKLGKVDLAHASPLYVRVRQTTVSKLIAVVSLLAVTRNNDPSLLPLTYAKEVSRCVDRSNDLVFKKLCESRLGSLERSLFPFRAMHALKTLNRKYGEKKFLCERPRRARREAQVSLGGMQTRSKAVASKKRGIRGSVSVHSLETLYEEGSIISRRSKQDDPAVENAIFELEMTISALTGRKQLFEKINIASDISQWIPILSEHVSLAAAIESIYLYKIDLKFTARQLVAACRGVNTFAFRDELESVSRNLRSIRSELALADIILERRSTKFYEAEHIVASFDDAKIGLAKRFADSFLRINSKLRSRVIGEVEELQRWLSEIASHDASDLFLFDINNHETVSAARVLLAQAQTVRADAACLLHNLENLSQSRSKAASLALPDKSSVKLALDDVAQGIVETEIREVERIIAEISMIEASMWVVIPDPWARFLRVLEWYIRARNGLAALDVNAMIRLHSEWVNMRFADSSFGSRTLVGIFSDIELKIRFVNDLISDAKIGKFEALKGLREICSGEIEAIRMDLAAYNSDCFQVIEISEHRSHSSIEHLQCIILRIEDFESRFSEISESDKCERAILGNFRELIDANAALVECRSREQAELVLSRLAGFSSIEIDKCTKYLEKTIQGEEEVEHLLGRKDSGNSFAKQLEIVSGKYQILKKVKKLKISIYSKTARRLAVSIFNSLSTLVRDWVLHGKNSFANPPKWTWLYLLRAVGGFLTSDGSSLSLFQWITKQLDLCNEILKESKKSFSDFSRNRFLIPFFHFSVYEPINKIAQNLENKLQIEIQLNYKSGKRELESICSLGPDGRVMERNFPLVGKSTVEPATSADISDLFQDRKLPKTLDDAINALFAVSKDILKESKFEAKQGQDEARHVIRQTGTSSSGGMSFTKFLSSSFASLEIEAAQTGDTETSGTTATWLNSVDSLITAESKSDNFFAKYFDLIEKSKKNADLDSRNGSPPATPRLATAPPIARPPAINPPNSQMSAFPGFAAPPSSVEQPVLPEKIPSENVYMWSGKIEGPKNSFSFDISIIPFFKSPIIPSADSLSLQSVLARHCATWQYEGSLSVTKFAEHYSKLMHPAHRRKREPYTFLVTGIDDENHSYFFDALPPNTATAFTILVPPNKIKLWIATVDGRQPYNPLPISPGSTFALLEMPVTLFHPSAAVENIYSSLEIDYYLAKVNSDLRLLDRPPLMRLIKSSAAPVQPVVARAVPEVPQPITPTPVPVSAPNIAQTADPLLSRVFEIMGKSVEVSAPQSHPLPEPKRQRSEQWSSATRQESQDHFQRGMEQWDRSRYQGPPVPEPPKPQYPGMSYYTQVPQRPPSSVPNIVIGAPTTGPSMDQLPQPRRGPCRFFNTIQGCQSGSRCRFTHSCTVCGCDQHGAPFHDPQRAPQPSSHWY